MHTYSHRKIPDWGHVVWKENRGWLFYEEHREIKINKKNHVVQSGEMKELILIIQNL